MHTLERWTTEAGERGVARLDIPPHATRERHFEIDVRFVVRPGAGEAPGFGLRVLFDGRQQWARHLAIDHGGEDSLDWRARVTVPVGEPLRIQAVGDVKQALRCALCITAEEVER
jgi:hypothetical protein